MKSAIILACATLFGTTACVLNVEHDVHTVDASYDESGWDALRTQAGSYESLLVVGHGEARVDATLTVEQTQSANFDDGGSAIEAAVDIDFSVDDRVLVVTPAIAGNADGSLRPLALELGVPSATSLDLDLGWTDVNVLGMHGPVLVRGDSGDVVVETLGPVEVVVGSGNLEIFGSAGSLRTSSGNVDVDFAGVGIIATGSGNVTATLGSGDIVTSSGNVVATVVESDFGTMTVSTGSGNVTVYLPEGVSLQVDVQTGSGSISVELGELSAATEGWYSETIDTGAGVGVNLLVIETGSGNVTVTDH